MGHHRVSAGMLEASPGEVSAELPVIRAEGQPSHGVAMLERPGGMGEQEKVVGIEGEAVEQKREDSGTRRRFRSIPAKRPRIDVVDLDTARPIAARPLDFRRLDRGSTIIATCSVMRSWKSKTSASARRTARPELRAGLAIDELRGDPEPIAGPPHAALEHVANAELARDLTHVDGAALVGEGRAARDDSEAAEAAERGDDVLDDAIGEIVLPGIAAKVWNGSTARVGTWAPARPAPRLARPTRR